MTNPFPHELERTVVIHARPAEVFAFFTDSSRWARWWGAGSTIDPVSGGAVLIRYPNGVEVVGDVVDIAPPRRLVFTFGFASGAPIAPGGSRVTITLTSHREGTVLHLSHAFADGHARDLHVQGWRYQLSVFANVVADAVNADLETMIDNWFAAWSEDDESASARRLAGVADTDVTFRNAFSALSGIADLVPHIAATRRFTPSRSIRREGGVRHCQGTLLVDWCTLDAASTPVGSGTSVFTLNLDRKIQSVVGFGR
jgi:uncharacterized protein YndB with AHSA1/START domain